MTPDKFVGQHEELFRKFAGAFCLEHLLWRYSNEALLTKKEINGIFHLIMQSLCGIITASVLRIEAPATVLNIKRSAVQCARALSDEVHEYNATAVFDTFRRLGAHFRHSLLTDTTKCVVVKKMAVCCGGVSSPVSCCSGMGWQAAEGVHGVRHVRERTAGAGQRPRGWFSALWSQTSMGLLIWR